MTARIGIYSGTFDPVHAGHIAFATATLQACKLERVIFLPEKQPRGKRGVTAISHRVALLKTALADTPALNVAEVPHPTFTVKQIMPELRRRFKGAELTLLVGSDVANTITDWPDAEQLLAEVRLAIGMRTGDSSESILARLGHRPTVSLVRTEFSGLTSSKVRNGEAGHATAKAAEYAREYALYGSRDRSYAA